MKNFFRKLEESLLSREVRKSTEKLNILLDDEFLEYGSSGKIYSKKKYNRKTSKFWVFTN